MKREQGALGGHYRVRRRRRRRKYGNSVDEKKTRRNSQRAESGGNVRVSTTKDRRRYYAFVDAAIPAEPDSNRSREILLLDCVDAEAFDRTGDALDQDENMPGNCLVLLAIKKRVEHFRSEDVSLPPLGGGETALVNLLPIVLPKEIFVASSPFDGARAIGELHHQENPPRFDWAIKNGTFWSFHDPREAVTRAIVDLDQVEAIETGCRRERSD